MRHIAGAADGWIAAQSDDVADGGRQ